MLVLLPVMIEDFGGRIAGSRYGEDGWAEGWDELLPEFWDGLLCFPAGDEEVEERCCLS